VNTFVPDPSKSAFLNAQELYRLQSNPQGNLPPAPPEPQKLTAAQVFQLGELKRVLLSQETDFGDMQTKSVTFSDKLGTGRKLVAEMLRTGDPMDDSILHKFTTETARNLFLVNWLGSEQERRANLTLEINAALDSLARLCKAVLPNSPAPNFSNPGNPVSTRLVYAHDAVAELENLK
jgi:hypothetical protein